MNKWILNKRKTNEEFSSFTKSLIDKAKTYSPKMYETDLFIFKPGQTFWCKDKPIISAATFHNAQIVDCHVTFSDDLYLKKILLKKTCTCINEPEMQMEFSGINQTRI